MLKYSKNKIINKVLDANINRAKEGLRVCEDITRFILKSHHLTSELKKIRHKLDLIFKRMPRNIIILTRQSSKDVGKDIYINELKRKNYEDILFANIQRVKESIRVLEEFSKLINKNTAIDFKRLRYDIYEIEKRIVKKILSLCHYR